MLRRTLMLAWAVCALTLSSYAQAVSTEPEHKKALLEVFTGLNCSWCPYGDEIAESILNLHPGEAFVIDIHTGSLAVPRSDQTDYTTAVGDSIGAFIGQGRLAFPSAAINRQEVEAGKYYANRTLWSEFVDYVLTQTAPVNLALTSTYDGTTNTLTCNVEGYFTGEIDGTEQRLNIAWTQDGIVGYQNGATNSTSYTHNHMLRGLATPLWGDLIDGAAKGQYFSKSYSIELPDSVGDVKVNPEDINVIAYVCNGRLDVENVAGGKPTYVNYGETEKGELSEPDLPIGTRWGYNFFNVKLRNRSAKVIENATFDVTVNGETQSSTATCSIDQFGEQTVSVPATYSYAAKGKTKYSVTLKALNGNAVEESTLSGSFQKPSYTTSTVKVKITTDNCAAQNQFLLKDADGNTLREFGPYQDGVSATYEETVEGLDEGKTYCIEILDSAGDGLLSGTKGSLITHTGIDKLIDQFYSITGFGVRSFFIVDNATGISETTAAPTTEAIYTPDGRKASASARGLTLRKMSDGSVKKSFQ